MAGMGYSYHSSHGVTYCACWKGVWSEVPIVRSELLLVKGIRTLSANDVASTGRRCARAAVTLAASGAMVGLIGVGTASAHESAPEPTEGGPLGAVQQSVGVVVHHLDEYHLSDPTWEIRSLLTSPQENIRIHMTMVNEAVDPVVGLLP